LPRDRWRAWNSAPAYDGDGGFSGYRSEFTYSRRIGQYWLGGFVRWPGYSTKTSHHA